MKIVLFIVLLLLFGCSFVRVDEIQKNDEKILIENPYIINLSNGQKYKL